MDGVTRVRGGGLIFEGGAGKATFSIEPDALKGVLKGGVGVRREQVPRPTAHGDYALRGYRTGRRISWSGLVETKSAAEHDHALLQLTGWGADGNLVRVQFDTAYGVLFTDVYLDDLDVQRLIYGRVSRYMLSVYAPDPVLLGETRTFIPGDAYHYGNFESWPTVTVTGTGAAYTVSSQGRSFQVTTALPNGQKDVIDMRSGRVRRNGNLLVGGVGAARVWSVPAGSPVTWSITGASATLAVTDSFI